LNYLRNDLPIAYASRTFNTAERNYSTTDQEMAAIMWGVKQFRLYVLGRHFKTVTDHKLLKWVFDVKDAKPTVAKMVT
jgi:hypothetical protein